MYICFKWCDMGMVYAEIELINAEDVGMARRHIIGAGEIKRMPVKMLIREVNTCASMKQYGNS